MLVLIVRLRGTGAAYTNPPPAIEKTRRMT